MMKGFSKILTLIKLRPILLLSVILLSCDVQVIEVSEVEFFIAKEWKLAAYYANNELQADKDLDGSDHSISNFRLKLNEDFTYEIINFDGTASEGSWSLSSGENQLTLSEYILENWLITEINIRNLDLRYLTPPGKPVDAFEIQYVLEPVRGQ